LTKEIGKWISENALSGSLAEYFAEYLELLGVSVIISAVLAPLLAITVIWMFWKTLDVSLDPRLEKLDLNDEPALRQAYEDSEIVFALSAYLSENSAESFEQFIEQVLRLKIMPLKALDHIDPDNLRLMEAAFDNKALVREISWKLGVDHANSIDELRSQFRVLLSHTNTS